MKPRSAAILAVLILSAPAACFAGPLTDFLNTGGIAPQIQAAGPFSELLAGEGEGPGSLTPESDKMDLSVGAGLEFGGVFAQNHDYGVSGGLGLFGIGVVEKKLAPGKPFPFPAVGTAEADLFYAPGKDGISDYIFCLRFGFGINLLWDMKGTLFYPYVTAGMGFESVTGSRKVGIASVSVGESRFILPFGAGAGFAMEVAPKISIFARIEFGFPANAANIGGLLRLQGGVLMRL